MAAVPRLRARRPAAWWLLVGLVWAGPLIIQLASPAAPFMDVLPNHVAPVEHVRVFGSFATLTTSPSPIYGPSRLMLGYVGLLGDLTTIANLEAILAVAAFALPLTILDGDLDAPAGFTPVRGERRLLGPADLPAHLHVHAAGGHARHRRRLPARRLCPGGDRPRVPGGARAKGGSAAGSGRGG